MLWRSHFLWLRLTIKRHLWEIDVLIIKLSKTKSHIVEIRALFFEVVWQLEFLVLV